MRECDISELHRLLSYDPETGLITRKLIRSARFKHLEGRPTGSLNHAGYLAVHVEGKQIMAHRIAWATHYGKWPDKFIDHINQNKADNRISNLREATSSQNQMNKLLQRNNSTGHRGVSRLKSGKYVAYITYNRVREELASSVTFDEAVAAYKRRATELFGEFLPEQFGIEQIRKAGIKPPELTDPSKPQTTSP